MPNVRTCIHFVHFNYYKEVRSNWHRRCHGYKSCTSDESAQREWLTSSGRYQKPLKLLPYSLIFKSYIYQSLCESNTRAFLMQSRDRWYGVEIKLVCVMRHGLLCSDMLAVKTENQWRGQKDQTKALMSGIMEVGKRKGRKTTQEMMRWRIMWKQFTGSE